MSKQPKLSWYSVTVAEEDIYDGKQIVWALCTTERIASSLRGCVTQWSKSGMKIFPGDILDIQKQT